MRFPLTILAGLSAIALTAGAADAASFNCGAAATPTEHAICDNPQLSTLDDQASGMYYEIVGSGAPASTINQVKSSQSSFIERRNACGAGYDCLISAYTDQIMYPKNEKSNLGL